MVWYDKHRACDDGNKHEGRMELITWSGKDDMGNSLGWGACRLDESEDLRNTFLKEYSGDEAKFYEYWPQGFRWTCCGSTGDMSYGCDHHGTGSSPCSCDFCAMGKPVPDYIFRENEQSSRGLRLNQGPDPRSFNPMKAQVSEMMRGLFGMDMGDVGEGSGNAGSSAAPHPAAGLADLLRLASSVGRNSPSEAAAWGRAKDAVEAGRARASGGVSSSSAGRSSSSQGPAAAGRSSAAAAAAATAAAVERSQGSSRSSSRGRSSGAGSSSEVVRKCGQCGSSKPTDGSKALYKCTGCKVEYYCSKSCQQEAWPDHRKECKKRKAAAAAAAAAADEPE